MKRVLLVLVLAITASAQTVVTFATAGSGTWIPPTGVTSIKVECIGGGGAGATMLTNGGGGGGGGGAYAARLTMDVTPGVIYNYTVGAAGVTNGNGNGGTTTFTGDGGVQCIAAGGTTAITGSQSGAPGGAAGNSTGDFGHVFAGGSGATGVAGSYGGGGGASGGSAATGTSATSASGAAAVPGGGPGGSGKSSPQGSGNAPANGPGGGGGGGLRTSNGTRSGGAGWAGQIVITYNTLTASVSDGVLVADTNAGQYTNNHAKSASVIENIPFTPSDQSRWGVTASNATQVADRGGVGYFASVLERVATVDLGTPVRPAKNFGADVVERILYTPAEQSRWGMALSSPLRVSDASSGVRQAFFHAYASVTENIPYMPAGHMDWGAAPTADGVQSSEALSSAYTPSTGGGTPPAVPRRPVVIK